MNSFPDIQETLNEARKIFCSENFLRGDRNLPSSGECEFVYVEKYLELCDLRMQSSASGVCGGQCLYECVGDLYVHVRDYWDSCIGRIPRDKLYNGIRDAINAEMLRAFADKDQDVVLFLTDIIGSDACTLPLLRVTPGSELPLGKWESYRKVGDWMMKAYANGYVPCAIGENERGPVLFITDFSAEEKA
jgi:hypothetical protein